jgi:hypothetical protein
VSAAASSAQIFFTEAAYRVQSAPPLRFEGVGGEDETMSPTPFNVGF